MSIKPRSFKTLRRLAHKIIERVRALKSSLTTVQGQAQNLNQRVNALEGQNLEQRVTDLEAAVQALQEQP